MKWENSVDPDHILSLYGSIYADPTIFSGGEKEQMCVCVGGVWTTPPLWICVWSNFISTHSKPSKAV